MIENGGNAKPTAAFQRVVQRAGLHAQELGSRLATGTNALVAICAETESPAARFLGEQKITRQDAANFIAQGTGSGNVAL